MNTRNKIALIALAFVVSAATQGCGVVNRLRAKDNLNEGVRLFNQGKIELSEQRFERALELSPDMANAKLFYARALNARFEQNRTEDLGLKTVKAYDDIIATADGTESVDRALAFKAKVYEDMASITPEKSQAYREKNREVMLTRAEQQSATDQVKADVYYTIGHGYWQEAYNTSRPFTYADGSLRQPIPPQTAERLKGLIQKAHEYFEKTIAIKPDYANAFFYQSLTKIQENYIETDPERKRKITAEIPQLREKYMQLNKQQQQQAGESGR